MYPGYRNPSTISWDRVRCLIWNFERYFGWKGTYGPQISTWVVGGGLLNIISDCIGYNKKQTLP